MTEDEVTNTTWWITGVYWCDEITDDNAEEGDRKHGNSFAFGPFPSAETCDARAADHERMLRALGGTNTTYEITNAEPLRYGHACKMFWETIQSEWFRDWYEHGWRADDGRIRKQRVA